MESWLVSASGWRRQGVALSSYDSDVPGSVVGTSVRGVEGFTARPLSARRRARQPLTAAHELGRLSLGDALGLTVLLAEKDPARYERAAVRWLGRFLLEAGGVEFGEAQLVLGALVALRGPHAELAERVLAETVRGGRGRRQ